MDGELPLNKIRYARGAKKQLFAEILIYGLVTSAIYAMLALGLTLIIGIARVMNLAHGAFYMLGAYALYTAVISLKLPLLISVPISLVLVALIAILVDILCLRPIKGDRFHGILVITLILALFFEELIMLGYGPQPRAIPSFISGRILIAGVSIPAQRLLVVIVSFLVISGLWIFIAKTRIGGAILSVSQDPEAASLMGINSNKIILLVNGFAAFLASLAGILVVPFLSASPVMWIMPFAKAFTIVLLGGLGSVEGSILAAFILGYSETVVSFAISPRATELVAMIILFLVIILRPSGLMGSKMEG